ncbi:MAG: ABC transporter permease [Patescibacteria group bacterium]
MHAHDLVQSAWSSLVRTRNRSLLTMLGIVIGIAAVILALSIGESAQSFILGQISSFGSDKLIVHPGPRSQTDNPSPFVEMTLEYKDVKRLRREPWLSAISAEIMQTDLAQAGGVSKNISLIGTLPDEMVIGGYRVADGAFLTDADVDGRARVTVLGKSLAEELFGQERAVGKSVKFGKNSFRVIGVMEEMGTQFFQNLDELAYISVTAMDDVYQRKQFEYIIVKTDTPLEEATPRIEVIMREAHNLDNPEGDPEKDDFFIMSQADAIKTVSQVTGVLQILLSSIAAISLLVGGIGIMNIMYVSVTERITEIGLRKAIGARARDVLRQFLAEAVLLTLAGGFGGVILGMLFSWIGIQVINAYQPGWVFMISVNGIVSGLVVSTVIGLVFGYFPARKAAALHPMEAMRTE